MGDNNPVKQGVETFDKKCLKKTNTAEKNTLPTKEGMFLLPYLLFCLLPCLLPLLLLLLSHPIAKKKLSKRNKNVVTSSSLK
uniref:Thymosin beta 1 n=1 Tax=Hucho hucho TaxID=62062 RepID=A0A4W5PH71_9TELE